MKKSSFRALHQRPGAFVIPNPWDVGTARILASLGFEALATTSAGMAYALGEKDGRISPQQVLAHCRDMVDATALPVSADLEKGFGDSPESVAETIVAAAETGLAGGSIEDYSAGEKGPIFDFDLAVERIVAAVETKHSLTEDFVLTARCENFLRGIDNLDDTIRRLQAYQEAGADVLYAPGLRDLDTIRAVCSAVDKPVNVLLAPPGATVADLAEVGAKRISVGSAMTRAALGAFIKAAREIQQHGTFGFAAEAISFADIEAYF